MTWFRADDGLPYHRKVRRLGKDKLPAMGLWTLAGCWSSGPAQSDGFIPAEIVRQEDPKERVARRLVEVGLWKEAEQDGERGYQFHDWPDWNPTADKVAAKREKRRTAGRLGGIRSGQTRSKREATGEANGEANASRLLEAAASPVVEPRPVPSFPTTSGAAAPSTEINTQTAVAAWVDAFRESTGRDPSASMKAQAGKEARQLLRTGADGELVLHAVKLVGSKGLACVEREYAPLVARGRRRAVLAEELTPERIEQVLGPDRTPYDCPHEDGPADKRAAWYAAEGARRLAERREQAARILGGPR